MWRGSLHLPVFSTPRRPPGTGEGGPPLQPRSQPEQAEPRRGKLRKKENLAGLGRRVSICECGPVALYYVLSCL